MAASKKSTKQTTTSSTIPTEFRLKLPLSDMSQTRPRLLSAYRPAISNIPKSSLSYPTTIPHPATPYRSNYYHQQQQQGERLLYVVKASATPRRAASARIPNSSFNALPLHQQPHLLTSPLLPRPHPQYGHFLAYLRRQSLARIRRKQEQEAGNTDNIESTIKFNPNKPISQTFQSTSHASLSISTPEISSMPTMSLTSKRRTRPLSSYQQTRRPSSSIQTNYRLTLNQSPSLRQPPPPSSPVQQTPTKSTSNEQLQLPTSAVLTPTNSIVDETTKLPTIKAPYELQLSGDMLNYCYVSDSGVKYQGQLLSTPV
ncbi:unnamed protein product [Rotaria sp. Silwood2]|nr:unnamed protein product [Rotaria sp. Silwood2]CAF2524609.1 unnamed protein product [Rotaria sp. Silwood2]CAF2771852.1 unnamed protein product [Rotaria sp. Silwood2]CAF2947261.1 unnamed protein product [Rotaria sp. Silwood2]CAF4125152.1 unnamed protein product [Rotaria sp. Silwood2]